MINKLDYLEYIIENEENIERNLKYFGYKNTIDFTPVQLKKLNNSEYLYKLRFDLQLTINIKFDNYDQYKYFAQHYYMKIYNYNNKDNYKNYSCFCLPTFVGLLSEKDFKHLQSKKFVISHNFVTYHAITQFLKTFKKHINEYNLVKSYSIGYSYYEDLEEIYVYKACSKTMLIGLVLPQHNKCEQILEIKSSEIGKKFLNNIQLKQIQTRLKNLLQNKLV